MISISPEGPSSVLDVYADARDLALLKRIAARDRDAISELYITYHPRLANFFARLTLRPGLIEQMTLDTLVAVWQRAGSLRPGLRVSTWIVGLAYRRALQSIRDDQWAVDDSHGDPASHCDDMGRALLVLPVGQRAVLAMIYCLGCSCEEVASILECPISKVKTQLLLARETLRMALSLCKRQAEIAAQITKDLEAGDSGKEAPANS